SDGIFLDGSSGNTIVDNIVQYNGQNGIYAEFSSDNNLIYNNNVSYNLNMGIEIEVCIGNNISDNEVFTNGAWGIYTWDCTGMEIWDNYVSDNLYGIHFWTGGYSNIMHNTAVDNQNYGIHFDNAEGLIVSGNTMIGDGMYIGGPLLAEWNTHAIDTSNTANGKPIYYWKDVNGGTVPTGAGQVLLANCTNVLVEDQNISGGPIGVEAGFSSYVTIKNNIFSTSEDEGIHIWYSDNMTISNNELSSNDDGGIAISSSRDNLVFRNTASGNNVGIRMSNADENQIYNNTLSSNTYGIRMLTSSCENNTIYHNNLIANTNQASDPGTTNVWNLSYEIGGNFWWEWIAPDINVDGYVDAPYVISIGAHDNYPFTTQDGWMPTVGPVHNVDTGEYFNTIQEAIDAANPFDTITVVDGDFAE
ncbi:MAG: right-handed parallel beta-helix repeat-containing protein, partial [Thermoplasmata archaeon]|nr:right-handed parallel beta-helix repeat-containing protein [Thermoplasmata archaeon]